MTESALAEGEHHPKESQASEGVVGTTAVEESFLDELHAFLSQSTVDLFFAQHPNALSLSGYHPPASWRTWWDWTPPQDSLNSWELLWEYYAQGQAANASQIPEELRSLIDSARRLQLLRTRGSVAVPPPLLPTLGKGTSAPPTEEKIHGMSPKKAHEVLRTVEHLRSVLQRLSASGMHVKHVVDVGAGQVRMLFAQLCPRTVPPFYKCHRYGFYIVHEDPGRMAGFQAYLSRALRDELGLHVLALDWSNIQSEGAKRREECKKKVSKGKASDQPSRSGSLTYKTLPINPRSLHGAIDEWISSEDGEKEVPVLFVALHACGSLTLDIFRAFISALRDGSRNNRWRPAAALIVGCCYNLLSPQDQRSLTGRPIEFHENHLQMAAQAPWQWNRTPDAWASTRLSFRKTAWRALLTGIIQECGAAQDHEVVGKRLGRVNDAVYESWTSFLKTAGEKFGLVLAGAERNREAEGRVEIFQLLRCILGPVVESFILLDRKLWLRNELKGTGHNVCLVNLFDQSTGSARNVAIEVTPTARVQDD